MGLEFLNDGWIVNGLRKETGEGWGQQAFRSDGASLPLCRTRDLTKMDLWLAVRTGELRLSVHYYEGFV